MLAVNHPEYKACPQHVSGAQGLALLLLSLLFLSIPGRLEM